MQRICRDSQHRGSFEIARFVNRVAAKPEGAYRGGKGQLSQMSITKESLHVYLAVCLLAALCGASFGIIACGRKPPAAALAVRNSVQTWEGTLQVVENGTKNSQEARFTFRLHRDGDKWTGEMRNYKNKERESYLPLYDVKVEGTAISFVCEPAQNGADVHYEGKISDDGKAISGSIVTGDLRIPLNLKRRAD